MAIVAMKTVLWQGPALFERQLQLPFIIRTIMVDSQLHDPCELTIIKYNEPSLFQPITNSYRTMPPSWKRHKYQVVKTPC